MAKIKTYAEYLKRARERAKAYYDKRKNDPEFLAKRAAQAKERRVKKKTA